MDLGEKCVFSGVVSVKYMSCCCFESRRLWVGSGEAEGFWVSPNEMSVDSWEDLRSLGRF